MKIIINVLLLLWQLPQTIIGFILSKVWQCTKYGYYGNWVLFTTKAPVWFQGVSLGPYIIFNADKYFFNDPWFLNALSHESGHQTQSKRWGPLYLLTVGVVSATRNLLARLPITSRLYRVLLTATVLWRVKNVSLSVNYWRAEYYRHWPENEADQLAGVKR